MKRFLACLVVFLIGFNINFSQTYIVESIPYNLPFDLNQITHNDSLDDMWNSVINLPFDFNFFENTHNQIVVSGNGVVSFDVSRANTFHSWVLGSQSSSILSLPGSSGSLAGGNIFFACHDLLTGVGIDVLGYQVFGLTPNRLFVVSILNAPHFACSSLETTQALVLYESTNIIEVFIFDKPICDSWNGEGLAVLGIQNNTGTEAYVPAGRNTGVWTAQMEAWRFSPQSLSVDNVVDFKVKVFPNPVSNFLNIEFEKSISSRFKVEIIDLQGELIMSQNLEGAILDVSLLSTGIYFLKVKNKDLAEKVFKLVKE